MTVKVAGIKITANQLSKMDMELSKGKLYMTSELIPCVILSCREFVDLSMQ